LLADQMDVVVRYSGGNNAGHTIMVGQETFRLHLLPAGVLYSHIVPMIGPGVVVDPAVLLDEMDGLQKRGVSAERLLISGNAHVIMPYHRELDRVTERRLGKMKLGTTKRGIGPAYADKSARIGIRVQDLLDPKIFAAKLAVNLREKNLLLTKIYGRLPMKMDAILEEYLGFADRLGKHIADTVAAVHEALDAGQNVLFEGAQGTLLDLDHGTYPFVTSSNPISGGVCAGAGVGPKAIERIIGVTKAYCTRVGEGPFPSEDQGPDGLQMVTRGREFGTTTGRQRRSGWFDAVAVRYAARLNSLTEIFLTKLDVLSEFETLKICVGYEYEGQKYQTFPPNQTIFHKADPIYEELPGWSGDISAARNWEDLPVEAQNYVMRLEDLTGVSATNISVGPEATETVHRFAEAT